MGPGMALTRGMAVRAIAAALALGVLGGCGGGLQTVTAALGKTQQADLNRVPRDKLVAFGKPIMRITIPGLGIDTLVSPREAKGDLVTWEAADGYTFTFRSGVLIETRGLGPDLMSSAAPSASQIAAGGATRRSYFYAWENDANQRRDYACVSENQGQKTVAIYGRSHATRHVVEACQRDSGRLSNEFWFEGGSIRQSKQWISPVAGPGFFYRVVD
jgi:hypothetical protein